MSAIVLPRRRFLAGLIGLVAAPMVVKATSLMPIKAFVIEPPHGTGRIVWAHARESIDERLYQVECNPISGMWIGRSRTYVADLREAVAMPANFDHQELMGILLRKNMPAQFPPMRGIDENGNPRIPLSPLIGRPGGPPDYVSELANV